MHFAGRYDLGHGQPPAGHFCDGEHVPVGQAQAQVQRRYPHRGRADLQGPADWIQGTNSEQGSFRS